MLGGFPKLSKEDAKSSKKLIDTYVKNGKVKTSLALGYSNLHKSS